MKKKYYFLKRYTDEKNQQLTGVLFYVDTSTEFFFSKFVFRTVIRYPLLVWIFLYPFSLLLLVDWACCDGRGSCGAPSCDKFSEYFLVTFVFGLGTNGIFFVLFWVGRGGGLFLAFNSLLLFYF